MHDNALNGNTKLLEDVVCALVPAHFIRAWRQWIQRPGDCPRPDEVDNSPFICAHGLLQIDPNSNDLDSSMCLVRQEDWEVLENLYVHEPAYDQSLMTVLYKVHRGTIDLVGKGCY